MAVGTNLDAEFGGDHHLFSEGSHRFTDERFIRKRAVHLGGIEKRDTAFERRSNQRDHLLLIGKRRVGKAHSHAAEPERRHLQVALSEFALLHCYHPRMFGRGPQGWLV